MPASCMLDPDLDPPPPLSIITRIPLREIQIVVAHMRLMRRYEHEFVTVSGKNANGDLIVNPCRPRGDPDVVLKKELADKLKEVSTPPPLDSVRSPVSQCLSSVIAFASPLDCFRSILYLVVLLLCW